MLNRLVFGFFVALLVAIVASGMSVPDAPEPKTYPSYTDLYRSVDNDTYSNLYSQADISERGNMLAAADKVCKGRLYEDFSCKAGERGNVRAEWRKYLDDNPGPHGPA